MKNLLTTLTAQQQDDEDSPLTRAAFAIGVTILLAGSVLPHREWWTMCGIALIAFSYVY